MVGGEVETNGSEMEMQRNGDDMERNGAGPERNGAGMEKNGNWVGMEKNRAEISERNIAEVKIELNVWIECVV